MCNHRYAPGFKDEALRQVVERGYSVAAVTVLIGSVFVYCHDYSCHPESICSYRVRFFCSFPT